MSQVETIPPKVAKRGLLWEWQAGVWIGGPLQPYAHRFPRSAFYYRNHGFAFTRTGALYAAKRSARRQREWMDRWE